MSELSVKFELIKLMRGEPVNYAPRVALSQLLRIYKDVLGHIVLRFAAGAY